MTIELSALLLGLAMPVGRTRRVVSICKHWAVPQIPAGVTVPESLESAVVDDPDPDCDPDETDVAEDVNDPDSDAVDVPPDEVPDELVGVKGTLLRISSAMCCRSVRASCASSTCPRLLSATPRWMCMAMPIKPRITMVRARAKITSSSV